METKARESKFILILILILQANLIASNNNQLFLCFSEIRMKVQGKGYQKIFNDSIKQPDKIIINDVYQNDITNYYQLNETYNEIKLIWNKTMDNCKQIFKDCLNIISIDFSSFDTSLVTDMSNMFSGCSSLSYLNISNFNTTAVRYMYNMFSGCSSLKNLNLSSFYTSNVLSMIGMFKGCTSLLSLNLSNFNTSSVTGIYEMFRDCSSLTYLNLYNFNTSKIKDMDYFFSGCSSLRSLNITNFNTSKVTTMYSIFRGCFLLNNLNLTSFDTSKVSDMCAMFYGCSTLISLNLFNFNTSLVEDMAFMFNGCWSLRFLNISNFDTSKVTNMNAMFSECSSLKSLNLSSFNTSQVSTASFMFSDCSSLELLNLSNFNTFKMVEMTNMFEGCNSLIYLDLSNYISGSNYIFQSSGLSFTIKYFNLNNTNISDLFIDINHIFDILTKNAILCANKADEFFLSDSQIKNCITINCSKNWTDIRPKLLLNGSCIDDCKESQNGHIYEYNGECFNNCPEETKMIESYENQNICAKICKKETPFLYVTQEKCFSKCNINDIFYKRCFVNTERNISNHNYEQANLVLNSILDDIKNINIYHDLFNDKENVSFLENGVFFELKKINMDRMDILNDIFGACQSSFPNFDSYINEIKCLYLLTINILEDEINKQKIVYELYYSLNAEESLTRIDLSNLDDNCFLKTNLSKCAFYSIESIINNKCLLCENNFAYYPIYEYINNTFIECFKNLEGYYLDEENKVYKKCYHLCKTCNKSGDEQSPNCTEYKDDYKTEIMINNYKSTDIFNEQYTSDKNNAHKSDNIAFISDINIITECEKNKSKLIPMSNTCISDCSQDEIYKYEFNNTCYERCPFNTKISKNNKFFCEIICPKEKPYEHIETQKCIENCSICDMFKNICKINYKEENKTIKEDLGKKIVEEILNGNLGELLEQVLNNKTDIIINEDFSVHQISSLDYQLGNKNLSSINLGICEDLLRQKYFINDNEELIIYKIEHKIEGFNIPIIEYILFTQNGSLTLDLSVCNNITVKYDIPVSINENEIDKYDPSSDFYNDECNKYSSDGKVDVTLYDRKNEFNNNNMSLCESKCIFKGYNSTSSKAICDCHIKKNMTYSYDDINQNELLLKIESEKSSSNLGVAKCNVFSSTEELKSNSGFYLLLFILIIFVIVSIIFWIKGRKQLEKKIEAVIYDKFEKNQKENKNKKNNITKLNNNNYKNKKLISKKGKKKKKKRNKITDSKTKSKFSLKENKQQDPNITDIILDKINNKDIIPMDIPDPENDYEMNSLSYIDALKYDKRSCCEYYTSLIKNKQLFAFSFCSFNDYNSGIIKKYIFLLSFALHYTINALFFNDSNMHQIYEDEGKYNFSYQFPKILISAICSIIFFFFSASKSSPSKNTCNKAYNKRI